MRVPGCKLHQLRIIWGTDAIVCAWPAWLSIVNCSSFFQWSLYLNLRMNKVQEGRLNLSVVISVFINTHKKLVWVNTAKKRPEIIWLVFLLSGSHIWLRAEWCYQRSKENSRVGGQAGEFTDPSEVFSEAAYYQLCKCWQLLKLAITSLLQYSDSLYLWQCYWICARLLK